MTIRYRVPKKTKAKRIAPIPLTRPKPLKAVPGKSHKYKLRTAPTDGNSPQYELTVPYFSTGSCEEWLIFRKNLKKVTTGLNLTTGSAKFELARNLLTGDALSIFNTTAADSTQVTSETLASFETCLDAVAYAVFPTRAELYQKRYMRRSLEKPADMSMREFMSRLQEINEYFLQFPVDYNGDKVRKLSEAELVEIGEYAIPQDWQDTMHLHNLDPLTAGVSDFIEFCERLETLESQSDDDKPTRKRTKRTTSGKTNRDNDRADGELVCLLHGRGNHTSDDCYQLKGLAKRHKTATDKNDSNKGNYSRSANKSYKKDSAKPQYTKNELNTIVKAMVKKALRGTNKRKRTVTNTAEELNQFESLSISGSEDNQHEEVSVADSNSGSSSSDSASSDSS